MVPGVRNKRRAQGESALPELVPVDIRAEKRMLKGEARLTSPMALPKSSAGTVQLFAGRSAGMSLMELKRMHTLRMHSGMNPRDRWKQMADVAMAERKNRDQEELEMLYEAFERFDTDGNHTLDKEEIKAAMKAMGMTDDDAKVRDVLAGVDQNGDDAVQLDEWFDFLDNDMLETVKTYIKKMRRQEQIQQIMEEEKASKQKISQGRQHRSEAKAGRLQGQQKRELEEELNRAIVSIRRAQEDEMRSLARKRAKDLSGGKGRGIFDPSQYMEITERLNHW